MPGRPLPRASSEAVSEASRESSHRGQARVVHDDLDGATRHLDSIHDGGGQVDLARRSAAQPAARAGLLERATALALASGPVKIRHLPGVDGGGRLVGMVTARDLRQALFAPAVQADAEDLLSVLQALSVGDIMTRGVVSVRAATSIRDAARLMHERKLGALPVLERERLAGILTETDVLRAFQDMLGPAATAVISR